MGISLNASTREGENMTITKQDGVYTAIGRTKDGREIECQAMTASHAMVKVYEVLRGGLIGGY